MKINLIYIILLLLESIIPCFAQSEPHFTYTVCRSEVEIVIPVSPRNNYQQYRISWDVNEIQSEIITAANLPYTKTKSIVYPAKIKVVGLPKLAGINNEVSHNVLQLNSTNFPTGLSTPFEAKIESLLQADKNTIDLKFTGSEADVGYSLYMRENLDPYDYMAPIRRNVKPGIVNITLPDPSKSYCFYVYKIKTCNYEVEESSEVCTINLKDPVINNGKVNLEWNSHPDKINNYTSTPSLNTLNKKYYIEKRENGIVTSTSISATSYQENIGDCTNKTEYRVVLEVSGLIKGYIYNSTIYSRWVTTPQITQANIPLSNITASIFDNITASLYFKDDLFFTNPKTKYYLYDSNDKLIDSTILNEKNFFINTNSTTQPLCYKMKYRDLCNSISPFSNSVCTIKLQNNDKELQWSSFSPFLPDATIEFQIVKMDNITNVQQIIQTVPKTQYNFSINPVSLDYNSVFKLRAININGQKSDSNPIEIPFDSFFHIPTIFTPNNDGINDVLALVNHPKNNFKSFDFKIYNRWGLLLFNTNDINVPWDGTYKSVKSPMGEYVYTLQITFASGEKRNKNGKVLLWR